MQEFIQMIVSKVARSKSSIYSTFISQVNTKSTCISSSVQKLKIPTVTREKFYLKKKKKKFSY